MGSGKVLYAKDGDTYILQFVGHIRYSPSASYAISRSLEQFLEVVFQKRDFHNVIIDMTQADSIDSTNLGLLAKVAIFMRREFHRKPTIVSGRENIDRILHTICFDQEFIIVDDAGLGREHLDELPPAQRTEREEAHMVLDAHKTLIGLHQSNEAKFQSVIKVLEQDIARKAAESG